MLGRPGCGFLAGFKSVIRWQRGYREVAAPLHRPIADQISHLVKEQLLLVLRALVVLAHLSTCRVL